MRMLRWMRGKTRKDMIRDERIRGNLWITPTSNKIRQTGLTWYDHITRRLANALTRRCLDVQVIAGYRQVQIFENLDEGNGKRPPRSWNICWSLRRPHCVESYYSCQEWVMMMMSVLHVWTNSILFSFKIFYIVISDSVVPWYYVTKFFSRVIC